MTCAIQIHSGVNSHTYKKGSECQGKLTKSYRASGVLCKGICMYACRDGICVGFQIYRTLYEQAPEMVKDLRRELDEEPSKLKKVKRLNVFLYVCCILYVYTSSLFQRYLLYMYIHTYEYFYTCTMYV